MIGLNIVSPLPPLEFARLRVALLHERAKVRQLLGQDAAAVTDFNALLEAVPTSATALLRRALSRRAIGDPKGAADDAELARRLRPNDPNFKVNYTTLHDVRAIIFCSAGAEEDLPLVGYESTKTPHAHAERHA